MPFKLKSLFNISFFILFVLCLVAESCLALSFHPYSLRGSALVRNLNPIRRDTVARKHASFTNLPLPHSSIVLEYGYDTTDPAQVSIQVQAHQERPILLLEAIDPGFFQSITCHRYHVGSSITITLHSEEIAQAVAHAWASNGDATFNVITSHFGCNEGNQRGAWSVSSIETHARTVILFVSSLPLREVGKSFDVSLRHSGLSGGWGARALPPQRRTTGPLLGRDFQDTVNPAFSDNLSGTQIFPGNSSISGLTSDIFQHLTDSSLEITCVDCSSDFNFTIGVDFSISGDSISTAGMFATVNTFEQSVVLDINLQQGLEEDFEFDLLKFPVGGWDVPGLFSIGPSIGIAVQFNFSITEAVDFTMGANVSIPANATASMDLLHPSSAQATGWDGASFNKVPLRINSGTPSLSIGAGVAPFIAFDISVSAGTEVGLEARLTQTTPSLTFSFSSPGGTVNSACEPVGDNDFAFFGTAYTVNASMGLVTSASVELKDLGTLENIPGLEAITSWDATLFTYELPWLDSTEGSALQNCYVLADDSATPTTVALASTGQQHPAPTGTLLAAAAAIPTYNMSKIEAYYTSHGNAYPPGITYQTLSKSGQQVPDTLKASGGGKVAIASFYSFTLAMCIVACVATLT